MQNEIQGTWTLVEAVAIDGAGAVTGHPLGKSPMGIVQIGVERLLGVICGGPGTVDGQRSLLAYSGPYTFDGRILATVADAASSTDMLVEQRREVAFESPGRIAVMPLNEIRGLPSRGGVKLTWDRVS